MFYFLSEEMEVEDGAMVTGLLGNIRKKRSPIVGGTCVNKTGNAQTIVVEKGERIHLPCHSCEKLKDDRFDSMQWMKLDFSPDSKGMYRVHEIIPGLHIDKTKNRITQSIDHTLTFKKARVSDAGSYFCRPPNRRKKERFADYRLTLSALNAFMANRSRIRFFFHVDVIKLRLHDVVDVSYSTGRAPMQPEVVANLNLEVFTNWHPWTPCSVCNDEGFKKRVGTCTVKKHNATAKVPNRNIDLILSSARKGIPCQSQFFADFAHEQWHQRHNEFEIEDCFIPCPYEKSERQKRSIWKKDIKKEFKKTTKGAKRPVLKQKVREGAYLGLICPGGSLSKTMIWINGSEFNNKSVIKRNVTERITFDMFGNIHIDRIRPSDAVTYTCWIEKKLMKTFEIKVIPDTSGEVFDYFILVAASFVVDFAVFFVLACLRLCNRKVQKRKKKKKKQKEEEKKRKDEEERRKKEGEEEDEEEMDGIKRWMPKKEMKEDEEESSIDSD